MDVPFFLLLVLVGTLASAIGALAAQAYRRRKYRSKE